MNTPAAVNDLAGLRALTVECAALAERLDSVPLTARQVSDLEDLVELQADLLDFHAFEAEERDALVAAYAEPRTVRYPITRRLP
jgi:hypothetical protein